LSVDFLLRLFRSSQTPAPAFIRIRKLITPSEKSPKFNNGNRDSVAVFTHARFLSARHFPSAFAPHAAPALPHSGTEKPQTP
jgi:hypothetical protein